MGSAALPGGAGECGGDGIDESGVGIGDDESDAAEAALDQASEEGEPSGAVFEGDDIDTEDLSVTFF